MRGEKGLRKEKGGWEGKGGSRMGKGSWEGKKGVAQGIKVEKGKGDCEGMGVQILGRKAEGENGVGKRWGARQGAEKESRWGRQKKWGVLGEKKVCYKVINTDKLILLVCVSVQSTWQTVKHWG